MSGPAVSSTDVESAKRVCARLHQAYRSLRLYPPDHPVAQHSLEDFVAALSAHVSREGSLTLRVEEERLVFEEEEVYWHEDTRGNLAFMMFRDGIRFLAFHQGIDGNEIEAFVDCLAHADDLAGIEYDLGTAFWERDLLHIEYEVVDPFLGAEGQSLRDVALNDLREAVVRRLNELSPGGGVGSEVAGQEQVAAQEAEGGGEDQGVKDELNAATLSLTEADVELGERAVADPSDVVADFALVLLEIAGSSAGPSTGEEPLIRSLSLVTEQFLDDGKVDDLDQLVSRLHSLEAQGRRSPEFGRAVVGTAVTAERLARLVASMSQMSASQAARVEGLLAKMRDWIFPTLLEILAESSDKAVRKTVLDLLDIKGGVPVGHLWPLLDDSRWYVVRNAVQLATGSGHPDLVLHLERLLRHPDARVRREVMRSLHTIGGSRSAALFARALSDEDSSVRILAANGLGRHGNRTHVSAIQAHVEPREFETHAAEEIAAFLRVYAGLGGEAAVDLLDRMWRRRVFGTRPLPLRVAAVQALGLVGSPAAQKALVEAAKSGEAQVQRAATRALAEARARIAGPST